MQDSPIERLIPPTNFAMVDKGIYRSAFIQKKNFPFLKTLGLKTVLFLCLEDYPESSLEFIESIGCQFFQFGVQGNKEPFNSIPIMVYKIALQNLLNPKNHPVLIHCNKGKHRTGCLVGCYRKLCGWSLTAIFEEYRLFAHPKVRAIDQQFIELFDTSGIRHPSHKRKTREKKKLKEKQRSKSEIDVDFLKKQVDELQQQLMQAQFKSQKLLSEKPAKKKKEKKNRKENRGTNRQSSSVESMPFRQTKPEPHSSNTILQRKPSPSARMSQNSVAIPPLWIPKEFRPSVEQIFGVSPNYRSSSRTPPHTSISLLRNSPNMKPLSLDSSQTLANSILSTESERGRPPILPTRTLEKLAAPEQHTLKRAHSAPHVTFQTPL